MNCFLVCDTNTCFESSAPMQWSNTTHWLTHTGPCGGCSGSDDLQIYKSSDDLTREVRMCALMFLASKTMASNCLTRIGFTTECRHAWLENIQETVKHCFGTCIIEWFSPLTENNTCIACDEQVSGKLFLRLAGRTRRNSGFTSEIDRAGEVSQTDNDKILKFVRKFHRPIRALSGARTRDLGLIRPTL